MRDVLGHASLTTTSRYLRSTAMRLERALRVLEESQEASERTTSMARSTRKPLMRVQMEW